MNHLEMEITFARNAGRDGVLDWGVNAYEICPRVIMLYGITRKIMIHSKYFNSYLNFQLFAFLNK